MAVMNTYTGKKFDPLQIKPEDVELQDIAHALSLLCRGGGHLLYFYPVGQHCINCMNEAKAKGWSLRIQQACLLHDASEAYIADMIRPIKVHMPNYVAIEDKVMQAVLEHFGLADLTEEEHKAWRQIDNEMLGNELKAMMWGERDRIPAPLMSKPDFQEYRPKEIEKSYLDAAQQLGLC